MNAEEPTEDDNVRNGIEAKQLEVECDQVPMGTYVPSALLRFGRGDKK